MRTAILNLVASGFAALSLAPSAHAAPAPSAAFELCEDARGRLAGTRCSTFAAPLDTSQPELGELELFVRRVPAAGASRGQVWLIAGGPGESGASFHPLLKTFQAAFPNYDLIIPDHRGTGRSTRLCPQEERPDSAGGTRLQGAEWSTCLPTLMTARARSFSITNAARDLAALMDHYSENKPTFIYGVSYGTQLVLRTLIVAPPHRVDGVILDSLVPPETDETLDLSHRSAIVDAVGRDVLARCDSDPACRTRLGGSALAAWQAIIDDPAKAALIPGGQPKLFFGALLDAPPLRARIPDLIFALQVGDPAPLTRARSDLAAFGAPFAVDPFVPLSIPLVSLISASENNARPGMSAAEVEAEARSLLFLSPLPAQLVGGGNNTYPRDVHFGATPRRLPPTLVLHGDLDPKTPLAGAQLQLRRLAASGRIDLTAVRGGTHFLALTAPDCFARKARVFVTTKTPPGGFCDLSNTASHPPTDRSDPIRHRRQPPRSGGLSARMAPSHGVTTVGRTGIAPRV